MTKDTAREHDYQAGYISSKQKYMFQAVQRNNHALVNQMFRAKRVHINDTDKNGWTALHLAADYSCFDVLKVLLQNESVNVNAVNTDGQTPLHIAAKQNDKLSVSALVQVPGINVNQQDDFGNTALHHAVKNNNPDLLAKLLAAPGINVNLVDRLERTPLLLTAELDHYFCAVLLLKSGADTTCTNYEGLTTLELACNKGHHEIVYILDHGDVYYQDKKVPNTERNILQDLLEHLEESTQHAKQQSLKVKPDVKGNVKECIESYFRELYLTLEKYLCILSKVATADHLQRMLDVWNCDFLRPRIDISAWQLYAVYPKTNKEGTNRAESVKQDSMLTEVKNKLYKTPGIKEYVQEVYQDSGKVFVSLDYGKKPKVEKFIKEQFGNVDLTYVEQEDFDTSIFLTGNDHSKFVEKSGIGPGSCIVKVGKAFVEDIVLTGKGRNLTFADILINGNMPSSGDEASGSKNVTGGSSDNEPSHGTLGCLAQVQIADSTELYGLSVKHILGVHDNSNPRENGVFVVTGIKIMEEVNMSIADITNESFNISFQDTVCLSDSCVGVHRENDSCYVDVVLLGPVHQHLLETHKRFTEKVEQEIEVYEKTGEEYTGNYVKKMGAVTRLTKGKVLNYMENKGLFVVVPRTEEKFADKGDSGAIVLLDEGPHLTGMGLVYKKCPEYKRNGKIYKDAVFCVRLDYCVDVLKDILKLDWRRDRIQLYYGHVAPNVDMQFKKQDSM